MFFFKKYFFVSTYSVSGSTNVLITDNNLSKNALQNSLSHYAKNQRIPRTKNQLSGSTIEKHDKKIAQAESNVFTKLALGNCMENLMKTSRQSLPKQLFAANVKQADDSSGSGSSTSIPHKSVQNLKREESIGIPIPPRRNNHNIDDHTNRFSPFMNSPPSGRYSPNGFIYGSPTMASSPVQSGGYLDAYGGGSSGSGKVSRAASPQMLSANVGGATGCGDYRLGFLFFVLCFC